MTDMLERISNIFSIITSLSLVYIAFRAHYWARRIHRGSPIEGRCYYKFNHEGTSHTCNLPCTIIPDIDIDRPTQTVKRAKVFREGNTWFNFQGVLDPDNIKHFGPSIWVYYNMPRQTQSMFLHWEQVICFEVWHKNKWRSLEPYQRNETRNG